VEVAVVDVAVRAGDTLERAGRETDAEPVGTLGRPLPHPDRINAATATAATVVAGLGHARARSSLTAGTVSRLRQPAAGPSFDPIT
jgi:hypothetical protein